MGLEENRKKELEMLSNLSLMLVAMVVGTSSDANSARNKILYLLSSHFCLDLEVFMIILNYYIWGWKCKKNEMKLFRATILLGLSFPTFFCVSYALNSNLHYFFCVSSCFLCIWINRWKVDGGMPTKKLTCSIWLYT